VPKGMGVFFCLHGIWYMQVLAYSILYCVCQPGVAKVQQVLH
jgi:hypothetical protein